MRVVALTLLLLFGALPLAAQPQGDGASALAEAAAEAARREAAEEDRAAAAAAEAAIGTARQERLSLGEAEAQAVDRLARSGQDDPASDLVRDLRFLFDEFYAETDDPHRDAARAAFTRVFVDSYAPAMAAQLDYTRQSVDHRGRTFEWQLLSSRIIFFTVIGLVAVGVLFSGWQFHMAMTQAATLPKGQEMTGSGTQSTLEVSPTGLKITSNVLGVVILALSLAFFYLYLEHVYEIREVPPAPGLVSGS